LSLWRTVHSSFIFLFSKSALAPLHSLESFDGNLQPSMAHLLADQTQIVAVEQRIDLS
jgi:hypothetical protein